MAGPGDEDEDGGGPLTPRTKGIIQHFKKQVREYTKEIDTDLQVVNEKVGVLEGGPISTNSKLVGMETSIGRVDKSLAALLRCFDDLHARTNNQHRGGVQEGEHIAENLGADYFADTEVEDRDHHYAITVRVWVTPPHEVHNNDNAFGKIQFKIPSFDGKYNPDAYLT